MTPDLEDVEGAEGEGFPPAERKVVTQSYDLGVQTLDERWRTDELVLPSIQREYVWDNPRASRLIESLLLNIPIPVLYFAETESGKWEIFDGQQRVRSVVRFLANEFRLSSLTVLAEFNGRRYHQLPEREQRFLKSRMMRAVVISGDSHPNMKFEIFERLNTGAVVLNAQELRNSLYRGSFNTLLRTLVKDPVFRSTIGTGTPRRRMVDEEFLLRFFSFAPDIGSYRPPLKKFLNEYMRSVQNAEDAEIDELRRRFLAVVTPINQIWGASAYRQTNAKGVAIENAPNRALFDAQTVAFDLLAEGQDPVSRKKRVIREFNGLFKDDDFVDSISLATGDRTRTLLRVRRVADALEASGLVVDRPPALE